MSEFVDKLLVQLGDPDEILALLAPAGDTNHTRLLALLHAAYDMAFATVHDVRDVSVRRAEYERPVLALQRKSGTWTQQQPGYSRTDVAYEQADMLHPTWLDVAVELALTLVLEVDPGQVESIVTRGITDFDTLDEFRAHFRFIDLDAFMARHGITTVDELREAFEYLLTEIRLRAPGPFDPNDPANQYLYRLNVAILMRDTLDVAGTMRDAKLARSVMEHSLAYAREFQHVEVRTPYAPVVIFPQQSLPGSGFNAAEVEAFFALEHVLALFVNPA